MDPMYNANFPALREWLEAEAEAYVTPVVKEITPPRDNLELWLWADRKAQADRVRESLLLSA